MASAPAHLPFFTLDMVAVCSLFFWPNPLIGSILCPPYQGRAVWREGAPIFCSLRACCTSDDAVSVLGHYRSVERISGQRAGASCVLVQTLCREPTRAGEKRFKSRSDRSLAAPLTLTLDYCSILRLVCTLRQYFMYIYLIFRHFFQPR